MKVSDAHQVVRAHRFHVIDARFRRYGFDVLCECGWEAWRMAADMADMAGKSHVRYWLRVARSRLRRPSHDALVEQRRLPLV